ncbi:MAG: TRAP transporter substrate-binding protein DctP [Sandaracinaceae bacterium]|nr:TRAP transporter substrate-binding protein DctP [Sandaracinaceae bacterium]
MRRTVSLSLTALLAIVLLTVPDAPIVAQDAPQTRTITFATLAPPGSGIMRGLEAWNREIRRRTDRGLQIRFYAGGVQGDEAEVIRKIRSGRLDAGGVTSTGLAQIHRPALIFQLPGTFRRYEQVQRAREALAGEVEAGMIQQGFRMLGWADVGQAHLFSRREIHTPADLAPCHFWLRTDDIILPTVFQIVRTNTVAMSVPEVLGGLQTGRIDTFLAPPAVAVALQWGSHATHMADTPVAILVGGSVISERTFQSLTPEQQTVLTETGTQFHGLARRNAARAEQESIAALRERGMTVVQMSPADVNAWRAVGRQVRERVASQIADPGLIARAAAFGEQ